MTRKRVDRETASYYQPGTRVDHPDIRTLLDQGIGYLVFEPRSLGLRGQLDMIHRHARWIWLRSYPQPSLILAIMPEKSGLELVGRDAFLFGVLAISKEKRPATRTLVERN